VIVRTWNLSRGTSAKGRKSYLREMVELVTADKPTLVCLQEVPARALEQVGGWASMQGLADREQRGLLSGIGSVVLAPREASVLTHKAITLNTNVFCEERGAALGLSKRSMRRWETERRICHLVQYELPNRRRFLVATLQATADRSDIRLADAELRRATNFIDRRAEVEETVIVAGDFNVSRAQSATIHDLESAAPEFRWTDTGARVENVLLRGAAASSARVWGDEERRSGKLLLSDHAPIEVLLPIAVAPPASPVPAEPSA